MKNIKQPEEHILSTNGLEMPSIFPTDPYEEIHKIIVLSKNKFLPYDHYSGAWNAIAYRFKAAIDIGDEFITSIQRKGSTPPPKERYRQEEALFNFFSSCFSTFESAFYGLYAIGVAISPKDFPLSTIKDQQSVSPYHTRDLYKLAFPKNQIIEIFNTLFEDKEYRKLRDTRNILTHRAAPGRRIYISVGEMDIPITKWKLNNEIIDQAMITNSRSELSRLLFYLLNNYVKFVKQYFK